MRAAPVVFAPVPAGVEWFPMRPHARAHMVEALVPPGSNDRCLGDNHPRAGWSVVAWYARDGWMPSRPGEPQVDLQMTVRDALRWCGRSHKMQDWVVDESVAYIAYLRGLLNSAATREAGLSRPTMDCLGDPILDLLLELGEAARGRPRRRPRIEKLVEAVAGLDPAVLAVGSTD